MNRAVTIEVPHHPTTAPSIQLRKNELRDLSINDKMIITESHKDVPTQAGGDMSKYQGQQRAFADD